MKKTQLSILEQVSLYIYHPPLTSYYHTPQNQKTISPNLRIPKAMKNIQQKLFLHYPSPLPLSQLHSLNFRSN